MEKKSTRGQIGKGTMGGTSGGMHGSSQGVVDESVCFNWSGRRTKIDKGANNLTDGAMRLAGRKCQLQEEAIEIHDPGTQVDCREHSGMGEGNEQASDF